MIRKSVAVIAVIYSLFALSLFAAEIKLGKPIEVTTTTSIQELMSNPEKYVGNQVRVEGEIVDVCQNMGCFMHIKDPSSSEVLLVKVNDGEIVFPKDGAGKQVIAQGVFEKQVLTKAELIESTRHMAEEAGRTVDTSRITAGKTTYRIKGQGAIIR